MATSPIRRRVPLPALVFAAGLAACSVDEGPVRPQPRTVACEDPRLPARAVRLTVAEYRAAVADLLGDGSAPPLGLGPDPSDRGYDNHAASLVVTDHFADQLLAAAEHYAARAVADPSRWPACRADGTDIGCARVTIDELAAAAFRRPPTADERDGLIAVYADGADEGFASGLELVITALLVSPSFLYRTELGGDGPEDQLVDEVMMTDQELAADVARLVTGRPPDAALLDAARRGALRSGDGRAAEVRRLFADAQDRQVAFLRQWLGVPSLDAVSKDATVFPAWNDALRRGLGDELERFLGACLEADGCRHDFLLTSRLAFVDETLATILDAPGGAIPTAIELPASQDRAGVLTRPAVLAAYAQPERTSPIRRGAFVLRRLLCEELPDPPVGLDVNELRPDPDANGRDRVLAHTANPACAGCHRRIDPIGFGLEGFDAIGRHRTTELGQPVEVRGEIVGDSDAAGPFEGAAELGARLAGSATAQRCFVREVIRYARGVHPGENVDRCVVDEVVDSLGGRPVSLQDVLAAYAASPRFAVRRTTEEADR